jgi:tRNA-dihydrouridine synthase C
MRIVLAPMEGLADARLRAVLTALPGAAGYDWCVSEFARVSSTALPARVFRRLAPELLNGARTDSGTPLRVQLLGDDPELLAQTAAGAVELAPFGIDLNFGCPAPLVNRHGGGASLLDDPEKLARIVAAVRASVPATMPVTAKMRLGRADPLRAVECAQALVEGGAGELVVHARTRDDGYRFPARWEWLGRIRAAVAVPVIANGDIFTVADWRRCREISGCDDLMIGRGAVRDPFLVTRLRAGEADDSLSEQAVDSLLLRGVLDYWRRVQAHLPAHHAQGRLKQWLAMLARHYPAIAVLYRQLRELREPAPISAILAAAARPLGLDLIAGAPLARAA